MTEAGVLVCDAQELMRAGLRMVVDGQSDLTVVGEAGDGETAVAQALTLRPDLVLMDVRLPHLDGISAGLGLRRPAPARLNRPSPLTAGLLRPASAAWPSTWAASTPASGCASRRPLAAPPQTAPTSPPGPTPTSPLLAWMNELQAIPTLFGDDI